MGQGRGAAELRLAKNGTELQCKFADGTGHSIKVCVCVTLLLVWAVCV